MVSFLEEAGLVDAAVAESVSGRGIGEPHVAVGAFATVFGSAFWAVGKAAGVVEVVGVAIVAASDAGCAGFYSGLNEFQAPQQMCVLLIGNIAWACVAHNAHPSCGGFLARSEFVSCRHRSASGSDDTCSC